MLVYRPIKIKGKHKGGHLYLLCYIFIQTLIPFSLQVQFEDLFTEPEGSHSIDGVWRASYRVFTGTKHWCYRILSAIFAVPCAFCWGLHFACLTFSHIWTIQPSLRSCNIEIYPMARLWGLFVRSFCDPFCESVGLMLSKIKISINKTKE